MAIPVVRSAAEDGGVNIGKIYMLNRHRHRRHHRPHLNHDHSSSLVGCLIIFLYTLFTPPTRVHTHFVMSGRSMLAGDDDDRSKVECRKSHMVGLDLLQFITG